MPAPPSPELREIVDSAVAGLRKDWLGSDT
jgi:hypothetical protein